MVQQIVYTDEKEDDKVNNLSKCWKLSKAETIKKIIREFKKDMLVLKTSTFIKVKMASLEKKMTVHDFVEIALNSYLDDYEQQKQIENINGVD